MHWLTTWRACLAICLTIFVSGCGDFSKPVYVAGGKVIVPDLDPRDRAPCADAGVDGNAAQVAVKNRAAWAECRKKHMNVVASYDALRASLKD